MIVFMIFVFVFVFVLCFFYDCQIDVMLYVPDVQIFLN